MTSPPRSEEHLLELAEALVAQRAGSLGDSALVAELAEWEAVPELAERLHRRAGQIEILRKLSAVRAPDMLNERVANGLSDEVRASRAASALGLLDSRPAPAELDGLVVAALQAGFREDRAAEAVRRMPPVPVPIELDEEVESYGQSHEEQRGPLRALPSIEPAPLTAMPLPEEPLPATHRRPRFLGGVAAAAALVAVLGISAVLALRDDSRNREYSFEVVTVDSFDGLDPMGLSLVDGATGGLLSSMRMEQR